MKFYDLSVTDRKGNDIPLSNYEGKVVMVVNTATGCGFTPQYEDLEELYEKYHEQGFEIIDVPCNQFMNQAPSTDDEIHEFCTLKYKTTFDQMKKADVNGENAIELFKFLTEAQPFNGGLRMKFLGALSNTKDNEIRWNFTKFIIDREGNVVKRFEPVDEMNDVSSFIEKLINK